MQILFFVISLLFGVFVGLKLFKHRMSKGHRKVTSAFWSFVAGFIVMCSSTILFEFVPWGQGKLPVSNLSPFDTNRALPASLIGDGSTDEDPPVAQVAMQSQSDKK